MLKIYLKQHFVTITYWFIEDEINNRKLRKIDLMFGKILKIIFPILLTIGCLIDLYVVIFHLNELNDFITEVLVLIAFTIKFGITIKIWYNY